MRAHAAAARRVGYIHVADMEEGGYEDFSAQYLAEARPEHAALILDLRGNAGGYTSDLLLARLTQRRLGSEAPAYGAPAPVPEHAPPDAGLVVLVDDGTASDGECLAHYLSAACGAVVVGARTWGGVNAMGEAELVDGTTVSYPACEWRTNHRHPRGRLGGPAAGGGGSASAAAAAAAREGGIENYGVAPDVVVEATPHDAMAGRDAQLEAALEEAAKLCAAWEAAERARAGDGEHDRGLAASGGRRHWSLMQ